MTTVAFLQAMDGAMWSWISDFIDKIKEWLTLPLPVPIPVPEQNPAADSQPVSR